MQAFPHGHWKQPGATGALRLSGKMAPMVLDGAMNTDAFRAYINQVLVRTLTLGDILIMDNLSAHKVAGIKNVIEAAGALLRCLRAKVESTVLAL